jgi:modification methylase
LAEITLPLNQILPGDCIEILATLPEVSVDLVFADPPYNLQLEQELWRPNRTRVAAVDDAWDKFANFEEYDLFTRAWLSACRRVLKDTGTLWVIGSYHNIYRIGKILQDLDYWILNDVIWIKDNPMPNFRGVRFTNAHETLIWAQKHKGAKYTFNHHAMKALNDDLQMRSDWQLPLTKGKERLKVNGRKAHSTQKPEALLYRVLLASSNPGDVVLDPFFGSGTTGAVAKKLGRHFIGIERDPEYRRIAGVRIAAVTPASAEALALPNKRKQTRIPFGTLLEAGLLQPGQSLYFQKDQTEAIILADGHLRCGDLTGSIHQVGRALTNAPCNGWTEWYYLDERAGGIRPLDELRETIRSTANSSMGENDGRGTETLYSVEIAEPKAEYAILRIEVDQSGKIEEGHDTVLAYANGQSYAIRIPGRVKREVLTLLKFRGWSKQRSVIWLFSVGLFLLLRDCWAQISKVMIDVEYPGHEENIKNILLRFAQKCGLDSEYQQVIFSSVGRSSGAHKQAIKVFRRKLKENRKVKLSDILALHE